MTEQRDSKSLPARAPEITKEKIYATGTRAQVAARFIVASEFGGIPVQMYLSGDCDHAPIVRGVASFTEEVYALLDLIDWNNVTPEAREAAVALKARMEPMGGQ
jgi:hypothetical protein